MLPNFLVSNLHAAGWELKWSDEFNGPTLNTANWNVKTGDEIPGQQTSHYYTNQPKNIRVENGHLVIEAHEEVTYGTSNGVPKTFYHTSAFITSLGKRTWTYGRLVMRAKLPVGKGMWPAFWGLGPGAWPQSGEIDVMEMIGGGTNDSVTHGTLHWANANNSHTLNGRSYQIPFGKLGDRYREYAVEWDASEVKIYIDGYHYHTVGITDPSMSEFHQPFYLILNLAVGGFWAGPPDASTVFPQKFEIDWVRVYQLNSSKVNKVPTAPDQTVTAFANSPKEFTLQYGDADDDLLVNYNLVSGPSHGTLIGLAPNMRYTPAPGFVGIDTFTYRVSDTWSTSRTATVSLSVDSLPNGPGSGITREWWTGISGVDVANLTSDARYPASPSGTETLTSLFEAPSNWGDNSGQRMHGYFIPPFTGSYTFHIASDDASELWLSTNANPSNATIIASVNGFTASREWSKYATQKSAAITLNAGSRYYISALHKEGAGGDHLAVGFDMPEGYSEWPIAGHRLDPWISGNLPPSVSTGNDQMVVMPASVQLTGIVTDDAAPGAVLTQAWSKVSGPGTVTFSAPSGTSTSAQFSMSGSYTLRLTANDGVQQNSDDIVLTVIPSGTGTGITREWWTGINGTNVANLTSDARYPASPSGTQTLTGLFEAPGNWGENFGQRLHGHFIAPLTGNYTFHIASDDSSELWLSTNANPSSATKIASVSGYTDSREWGKYATQQSAPIPLIAGNRYYISALHKEAGGGDNLAVGVDMPEGYSERPIAANRLVPWISGNAEPTVATAATSNPMPPTTTALSVLGADNGGEPSLTYTWASVGPVTFSANGSNAAKSTVATFTTPGVYPIEVTITDAGGLTATSSVTVTIQSPTDFTWGGGTLDWTNTSAAGWNFFAPGAGDNATIGSGTVTVTTNVGNLNIVSLTGTGILAITTGQLIADSYTSGPTVTLGSGSTLRVNDWNFGTPGSLGQLDFGRNRLVVNGGTIEYTGNSNVTDGQAGRNFTVGTGGATLKAMTAGQTWTLSARTEESNRVIENNNGLTLGGIGNGVIVKPVNGGGSLTKTDSGTWTLTGLSTNSGGVTISGGKLAVTGAGKLYSNLGWQDRVVTIQSGGVLEIDRWNGAGALGELPYSAQNIVLNNGTIRYTGTTNGTDAEAHGIGFTIGAEGATLESATVGQTWNIVLDTRDDHGIASTASGTLNLTGTGDGLISKVIPGAGGLTKSGSGTWTLSATNTYTGNTAISAGTLRLGTASLANTSSVSIATGATLDLTHSSTDIVRELFIGGVQMPAGIYKSSAGLGVGTILTQLAGTGKLEVTTGPSNTFVSWMGGFDFSAFPGADLSATGDADNDGIDNLIEQVFGTAPNAATTGITQVSAAANAFTFKHPLNPNLVSNVTYSYQWSSDLVEWKTDGQSNSGGTTVTITAGAPVANEVTVTATITAGPAAKLYVRVIAREIP